MEESKRRNLSKIEETNKRKMEVLKEFKELKTESNELNFIKPIVTIEIEIRVIK